MLEVLQCHFIDKKEKKVLRRDKVKTEIVEMGVIK